MVGKGYENLIDVVVLPLQKNIIDPIEMINLGKERFNLQIKER